MTRIELARRTAVARLAFAVVALVALASVGTAHADPLKVTPSLAAFKQYGPKVVAFVFAVNVQEAVPPGYRPFVHIVDKAHPGANDVAFQADLAIPGTPDKWPVGQTTTGPLTFVSVPQNLADGEYDVRVGLYDAVKGPRLELTGNNDGNRRYTVGKIVVAGASITGPGTKPPTPAQEGRVDIAPSATDLAQTAPRAYSYRLVFDVNEKLASGFVPFLHVTPLVVTKDHDIMFQSDPGLTASPDTWTVGRKVTGKLVNASLPADLPDGTYTIRVGLYNPAAQGVRAKLIGDDDGGQRFTVAQFTVAGSKITFAKP